MAGFLGASAYLWLKAAHVIFAFFFMAGLFLLPRYLVHQAGEEPGSVQESQWSTRTALLRRMILTPSVLLVWGLGLLLAADLGFAGGWLHVKIVLVALLTAYHGFMVRLSKQMAAGRRPLSGRQLRIWNEVPALLLVAIVILVVVKPF